MLWRNLKVRYSLHHLVGICSLKAFQFAIAAAMSITTLYRASRASSQRAYNNGYIAALEDLRSICSDVSRTDGGQGSNASQVARILHWIDARLEAVRLESRDEDEEDDPAQHPRTQQNARYQSQLHVPNQSNVQSRTAPVRGPSGSGNEAREKTKLKVWSFPSLTVVLVVAFLSVLTETCLLYPGFRVTQLDVDNFR